MVNREIFNRYISIYYGPVIEKIAEDYIYVAVYGIGYKESKFMAWAMEYARDFVKSVDKDMARLEDSKFIRLIMHIYKNEETNKIEMRPTELGVSIAKEINKKINNQSDRENRYFNKNFYFYKKE